MKQVSDVDAHDKLKNRLLNRVQENYNLKEFLINITKDELNEIRRTLNIKGISKLKKEQLVEELEKWIFNNLHSIMTEQLNDEDLKFIKSIINKGGILDYKEEMINSIIKYRNLGIAFSGTLKDERKVIVIPKDLRLPINEFILGDTENEEYQHNFTWINIIKGLLYYYGVLPIEDAYKITQNLCDTKIDFYSYIVQAACVENECYYYNKEERILYLKSVEKPFYILHQQNSRKFSYFPIDMDSIEKVNRKGILYEEKEFYNLLINNYRIDNKDARKIVEIFINKIRNGYSLKDSLDEIAQFIHFKNMKQKNKFISYLSTMYNNTRMWSLKGYTPYENSIMERGKKIPVVKKPSVGRNELCPCGSGKKYKKCCGK